MPATGLLLFTRLQEEMMNANATVTENSQYLTSPQRRRQARVARSVVQISSWALSSATSVDGGCLDRTCPA